jgi:hypothetical protein
LEQLQAGHTVRQIAHGRLDGDTNAELAAQLQLSLRVVVRKLQLIRRPLSQELES